jgi:hypothetical protein
MSKELAAAMGTATQELQQMNDDQQWSRLSVEQLATLSATCEVVQQQLSLIQGMIHRHGMESKGEESEKALEIARELSEAQSRVNAQYPNFYNLLPSQAGGIHDAEF